MSRRGSSGWEGQRYDGSARLRNGYVVHGLSEEYVAKMELIYMAIIAAVPCPKCKARKGDDCRTDGGNRAVQAHWGRHLDWRAFLAERYGSVLLG